MREGAGMAPVPVPHLPERRDEGSFLGTPAAFPPQQLSPVLPRKTSWGALELQHIVPPKLCPLHPKPNSASVSPSAKCSEHRCQPQMMLFASFPGQQPIIQRGNLNLHQHHIPWEHVGCCTRHWLWDQPSTVGSPGVQFTEELVCVSV